MIESTFLVPLTDNNGQPFTRSAFAELEDRLIEAFGGFTIGGERGGVWVSDSGVVYRDRSLQYVVALSDWRQMEPLLAIVDWVLARFQQEALYITVAGVPNILGPREPQE